MLKTPLATNNSVQMHFVLRNHGPRDEALGTIRGIAGKIDAGLAPYGAN